MIDKKTSAVPDCATQETDTLADFSALQQELRILVHDQLQLAALELRLAAHSLTNMIMAALVIGALMVMAWAGLMTAAVLGLVGAGLQPASAVLLVAALTGGIALLLLAVSRRLSLNLGFPASLRALMPSGNDAIDREAK